MCEPCRNRLTTRLLSVTDHSHFFGCTLSTSYTSESHNLHLYNINIRYNSISGLYGYFWAQHFISHTKHVCSSREYTSDRIIPPSPQETATSPAADTYNDHARLLGNPGPLSVAHTCKYNTQIPTTISEYIYNCLIATLLVTVYLQLSYRVITLRIFAPFIHSYANDSSDINYFLNVYQ